MQEIKSLLQKMGKHLAVELLTYHAMGESKYSAINKVCQKFVAPTKEKMAVLKSIFN
jgi:hypothetical protein